MSPLCTRQLAYVALPQNILVNLAFLVLIRCLAEVIPYRSPPRLTICIGGGSKIKLSYSVPSFFPRNSLNSAPALGLSSLVFSVYFPSKYIPYSI